MTVPYPVGTAIGQRAGGSGTTISITMPAETEASDLLVVAIRARTTVADVDVAITPPTGFTRVPEASIRRGTTGWQATYLKVADAGDLGAVKTWTFINTDTHVGIAVALRGVDTADPVRAAMAVETPTTASPAIDGLTTEQRNSAVLSFYGTARAGAVINPTWSAGGEIAQAMSDDGGVTWALLSAQFVDPAPGYAFATEVLTHNSAHSYVRIELASSDPYEAKRGMQDGSRPGSVRPGAFRPGAVLTIPVVGGDTTPPGSANITATVSRISRVTGKDTTDLTFSFDEDFVEYELRLVTNPTDLHTQGTLVEMATVAARDEHTITVTDDELVAAIGGQVDGPYMLKAFVRDDAGNWST